MRVIEADSITWNPVAQLVEGVKEWDAIGFSLK